MTTEEALTRLVAAQEQIVELLKPISCEYEALGRERQKAAQKKLAAETAMTKVTYGG